MAAAETPFAPIARRDGYLPLEDLGLIGDGRTAALVGRDGSIPWLCLPRFDDPAVFCAILDKARGGAFTVAPQGLEESRQRYEPDTGVLVTEMRGGGAHVEVTDALALRHGADLTEDVQAGRDELLRSVRVLKGPVRLEVAVEPRGGAVAETAGEGLRLRCARFPGQDLLLSSSRPLPGPRAVLDLQTGESLHLQLCWRCGSGRVRTRTPEEILRSTIASWRRWIRCFSYEGPRPEMVRRSAITLKLLDHFENGAIVAAPTSSLPETIGGVRNWDYRYVWIRDAAFSVYGLRRIGLTTEAEKFMGWVLDAVDRMGRPRVMFDLDGNVTPPEVEDRELEGYRASRPVRWGNAAAEQRQHDVYGEILDCAWQWVVSGGKVEEHLWGRLRKCADAAAAQWREPDRGIWEVRSPGLVYTYSAAMCQVALERAARIAAHHGLPGDVEQWRREAAAIQAAILEEAWDEEQQAITEALGGGGALRGGGLDASALALPLRRVLEADHPKMVATTRAIMERLSPAPGLVHRYLPHVSPDGLPGGEGAFLLCSFWLVDNLAYQGHLEEASTIFDSLCDRAGPLGLLPEEIDPGSGAFLGNYPQAFSHVGLISSGFNLGRLARGAASGKGP